MFQRAFESAIRVHINDLERIVDDLNKPYDKDGKPMTLAEVRRGLQDYVVKLKKVLDYEE